MSDIKPLSYVDPMAEVLAILKEQHPDLDTSKFTIERAVKLPDGSDRNTELTLLGNPVKGMFGTVKVRYDRLNTSKALSKFGNVTKNPVLRISAFANTPKKISEYIGHINNLLGLSLSLDGDFPDIMDQTFVVPTKGSKITVAISPFVSATGYAPVSLRIEPSTSFSIEMLNLGGAFGSTVVSRSLNPFSKDNALVWSLDHISITAPSMSTTLALYNADFSAAFGTDAKVKSCFGTFVKNLHTFTAFHRLSPVARDRINPILENLGLPIFTETAGGIAVGTDQPQYVDDRRYSLADNYALGPWPGRNSARTITRTKDFWGVTEGYSLGKRTPPPVAVNPAFDAVAKLYPPNQEVTDIRDGLPEGDNKFWYLHYNTIV